MRRFPLFFTLISSCLLASAAASHQTISADYVFDNANVVPMNKETILKNRAVAVKNGKIVAILAQSMASRIHARAHINADGRYLMPGLADMHVHMRMDPKVMFNLLLANGVTTAVNMRLDDSYEHSNNLVLRADLAAGRRVGPNYLLSGPFMTPETLPNLDAIMPMLDQHLREKLDVVKIHDNLDPEIYAALLKGARARGLRVTGHAQHLLPLSETLKMTSLEHIEEFLYVSPDGFGKDAGDFATFMRIYLANLKNLENPVWRAAIVGMVRASKIYLDPTLIIYDYVYRNLDDIEFAKLKLDPRIDYLPKATRKDYLNSDTNEYRHGLEQVFGPYMPPGVSVANHIAGNVRLLTQLLLELHATGVPLLVGSDSFGLLVPGFPVHQELALFVEAGLRPYDALRAATVNVAAYFGEADNVGTVEVGKRADLIMLERNPLLDIHHAGEVRGVLTHNKWYAKSDLQALLEEARFISNPASFQN